MESRSSSAKGVNRRKRKPYILILIEYLGFILFESLLYVLPEKLSYFIADIVAQILFFIDRKHRRRTIQHLLHAGVAKEESEAVILARKNYRYFASMLVDVFRMPKNLKEPSDVLKLVKPLANEKIIKEYLTPGKSAQAIIVTGHFGNWELAGSAYCCLSGRKMLTIMRDFDNPLIGRLFISRRIRFGHNVISKRWALKEMIKAAKSGQSICFLADQHPGDKEGVEVKFFGRPARAHTAPIMLHLKTGIPILVGACRRNSNKEYNILAEEPITSSESAGKTVQELAQIYTDKLEKIIRQNPEQWLWAHRRWTDINR